jgi:hypothetical protein
MTARRGERKVNARVREQREEGSRDLLQGDWGVNVIRATAIGIFFLLGGCSPSVSDKEITIAIAKRVGDDPSRQAWALYKGETPIAAFWNSVDLTVVADATTDPWLRGNRAGCESLLASITAKENAAGQTQSSYRCKPLK